ncbi:MAG: nuclear transport factor 2 family protein [Bdellovibrio bacteriovorus]
MTQGFDSPEAVEAAFYAAFAATDLRAMERVWLDGERTVCVHPGGGLLMGKGAVMQSWSEILMGAAPPRIEHRLINRIESAEIRVHLVEERIQAGGDPAAPLNLVIATNVYTRDSAGWHLMAHHASLPLMRKGSAKGATRRLH